MTTYSGNFAGTEGGGDIGQTAVWSGTLTVDTVANTATITVKYTDISPLPVNPNFSGSDTEQLAANVIFFSFPQSPGWRADFSGFGNLFGGQSTITGNIFLTYFPTSTQDGTSVTLTTGSSPPPPSPPPSPPPPTDTTPPVVVKDNTLTAHTRDIGGLGPNIITSNLLTSNDPDNSHAQLNYQLVSTPQYGVLLKNGSATSSFTQADIDNGLISYVVTAAGLTSIASDAFTFIVSDIVGNSTGSTPFIIKIVTGLPPTPGNSDYTPTGVLSWAYGQAALFYNPATQPLQFLNQVGLQLVNARQLSPTDPVYRDAEYYHHGVVALSGYGTFIDKATVVADYINDVFKLFFGSGTASVLGTVFTHEAPAPNSNAGGLGALIAGLIVGGTGLWQKQATQNWQSEHPGATGLPSTLEPSAATGSVVNLYQRSAAPGSDDYTAGDVDFHIVIGPNLPQGDGLVIFDLLNGTPLNLAGNDLVFEGGPNQTIYSGNGNSQIFLGGGGNVVYVGMGSDVIVGSNTDALDYAAITGSVTVDLSAGAAKKSNGGTDLFGGVHVVIGSPGNDAITSDSFGDVVVGGGDVISPAIATAYTPAGAIGTNWTIIGTKDVSGDGKADYLWANAGKIDLWTISNGVLTFAGLAGGAIGSDWTAKTTGDFNHDGFADVLWVNAGRVAVWELQGTSIIAGGVSNGQIGSNFSFKTLGDFNHDGNSDVLWQSNTGQVAIWLMQGSNIVAGGLTNAAIGTDWTMGGTGDFNGDGRDDALWFNSSGQAVTWLMNGTTVTTAAISGTIGAGWKVGGIADMNMDGKADVVWWNPANNAVAIWYMNGTRVAGSTMISNGGQIGTDWKLSGVGDVTGDGIPDVVWTRPNGSSVIWNLRGNGDLLIGGAGRDTFQINTLSEMGEVISNFQPGAGQDVLDLHNLLTSIGHGASDAFVDGTVRLVQDGTAVEVEVDTSPGEHHYVRAATLQNVAASTLVPGNFQLSASAGSLGDAGSNEQAGDVAGAASASMSDPGAQFAAADTSSQLVQAMAGFGGGSGAADALSAGVVNAGTSEQPLLLTTPQHA